MGNCLFLRRGAPPSSGPDIFGVVWDYANSTTSLTRLTAASDPNGYVTVDITEEPSPALSTGAGSSPFDNFMPWAGMEEYNIINSAVAYRQGDAGFSRSDYDTMVYIPEFYYAVIDDAATNYTAAGVVLPHANAGLTWIKGLEMNASFPWAFLPNAIGGSETTYIPDYMYMGSRWRGLNIDDDNGNNNTHGLFYFYASFSSRTSSDRGTRLLFIPQ